MAQPITVTATLTLTIPAEGLDVNALDEQIGAELERAHKRLWAGAVRAVEEQWRRDEGGGCVAHGMARRRLTTRWGEVVLARRRFRERATGRTLVPFDRRTGLTSALRRTDAARRLAVECATERSYAASAQRLWECHRMDLSAMTVHREVQRAGAVLVGEREGAAEALRRFGALPARREGCGAPAALVTEVDGAWLHAWRGRGPAFAMHLLVAYTGKRRAGGGRRARWALRGKRLLAWAGPVRLFGPMAFAELEAHYAVSDVALHLFMSDGEAAYERLRAEHFPWALHQADWMHLQERLVRAAGQDRAAGKALCKDLYAERLAALAAKLRRLAEGPDGRAAADALKYLEGQSERLYASRAIRRLPGWPDDLRRLNATGAAESNIKSAINARFKGRGMGWTVAGANRLVALCHARGQDRDAFGALFRTKEAVA